MLADQFPGSKVDSALRWYVVQTQPRRERLAVQQLANQGFQAFCPMGRSATRARAKVVQTLSPFFPGYVFVNLDLVRHRWRSVNGTIGVVRLVTGFEGGHSKPAPLPEGLVERLITISSSTGALRFQDSLSPGDAIRIVGGPFDQLCGTLEAGGAKDRVTILLDILAQGTRVSVARDILIAA